MWFNLLLFVHGVAREEEEEDEAMSMNMSMTAAGEGGEGEEDSGSDGSDLRIFRDDEDKNVRNDM